MPSRCTSTVNRFGTHAYLLRLAKTTPIEYLDRTIRKTAEHPPRSATVSHTIIGSRKRSNVMSYVYSLEI